MSLRTTLVPLYIAVSVSAMAETAVNPMEVDPADYLDRIKLPDGFEIAIFADHVTGARSLALSPAGTLFVGTFTVWGEDPYGIVHAVLDRDGDGRADEVFPVIEDLNHPNGVAFHDGDLYVAEIDRVLVYEDIERDLRNPPPPRTVSTFPADFHHGWKYIAFGPDGKLYVPVGAPCNICEPGEKHALIARLNADGSEKQVFARGVRNSVGFDWHPQSGEMFFSDNGRDDWGNDRPPEEINHAARPGLHFGFPYRYGKDLVDETYPTSMTDDDFVGAAVELPAHNACLGLEFYTGRSFPEHYHNQAFVACHGSWNRNPPDGYRVNLITFEGQRAVGYEHFATGWLLDEKFWGRPVDLEVLPDGSLLVSDDFNHVIYRIQYKH